MQECFAKKNAPFEEKLFDEQKKILDCIVINIVNAINIINIT